MSGLRERNKAARISAILDSAVELLGTGRLDEVTTERIAARAEVAPATVYNLVGTRDELLAALVDRVVDDLVGAVADATADDDDPISVARLFVDHSVAAFTRDSHAFRQFVEAGRALDRSTPRDRVDPSQLQVAALRRAQELGILRDDVDPGGLGRQVFISWIGAMEHWASGHLDDDGFAVATRHGLLVVLAAASTEPPRADFIDELRRCGELLDRAWLA